MPRKPIPGLVKNIEVLLILILMVKIAGYFSIVEDRGVNQVFKTISRLGITGAIVWVQHRLTTMGCVPPQRLAHNTGPFLYIAYLSLGLASFLWTSDISVSALQWAMTTESFVFT